MISDLCVCNFTVIVRLFRKSPLMQTSLSFIDPKTNIIGGMFGSKINSLLRRKSSPGNCKVVGDVGLGAEIDPINHTFSGALGLLQAGKGDVILDSFSQHLKKPWFEHSHASSREE